MSCPIHILYPADCWVSEETMFSWAKDAIDNGEIEGPADIGLGELIGQMHDAGLITVAADSMVQPAPAGDVMTPAEYAYSLSATNNSILFD